MESSKAGDGAVDGHGVGSQLAPTCQDQPVRVGSADEHPLQPLSRPDVVEISQLVAVHRQPLRLLDFALPLPQKQFVRDLFELDFEAFLVSVAVLVEWVGLKYYR